MNSDSKFSQLIWSKLLWFTALLKKEKTNRVIHLLLAIGRQSNEKYDNSIIIPSWDLRYEPKKFKASVLFIQYQVSSSFHLTKLENVDSHLHSRQKK